MLWWIRLLFDWHDDAGWLLLVGPAHFTPPINGMGQPPSSAWYTFSHQGFAGFAILNAFENGPSNLATGPFSPFTPPKLGPTASNPHRTPFFE
jgi:hypothetical protein